MIEPVLSLRGVQKSFGGLRVTDNLSLDILPGELHALIGPNGAGKTTLINQVSGLIQPDAGEIVLCGQDVTALGPYRRAQLGLARSFQITSTLPTFSALENVSLAVQARSGSSYRFFLNAASDRSLAAQAMDALHEVGLSERAHIEAGHLSHGERRTLELAVALATNPKLLVLDEPMAGTGRHEGERIVEILQHLKRRFPIILVEHDMKAVFALADRVSVLIYGRILLTGTPNQIRSDPAVIAAYLGDETA